MPNNSRYTDEDQPGGSAVALAVTLFVIALAAAPFVVLWVVSNAG